MKLILFFHRCNDYTGSTRVLSNIIQREYCNQEVTIITHNPQEGFLTNLPNVKIVNVFYPTFRGKSIFFLSSLVGRLHSLLLAFLYGWKYEIFYINTLSPYYAALIGRLLKKKIIWHVHEKFIKDNLIDRFVEKVFNHTPAHRIFVSSYVKMQFEENIECTWEIQYNKLSNIFLDNVKFKPVETRKRNQVLMVASLSLQKGVDTFVKLSSRLPELHFRLILSSDAKRINDFFFNVIIPPNCELIPVQADIQPFLEESDLILNLSNPLYCVETFGMTILEAMPYGIPAIVPNIGGPIELVENGYNGYCVDVINLDVLINIIHLSLDEDNYARLVKNTRNRYFSKFKQ